MQTNMLINGELVEGQGDPTRGSVMRKRLCGSQIPGRLALPSPVWTSNTGRAMQTTANLRYGFTGVNTHGVATPEMPWAGMKSSGTGCDMSVFALNVFPAVRHVMTAHG